MYVVVPSLQTTHVHPLCTSYIQYFPYFSLYTIPLSGLLSAATLCDCSPAPSLYFSTSSLSTGIKRIPLINVLAASLSSLVEPSRGQDPYPCNVSEFCMALFYLCLSVCLHLPVPHFSLIPSSFRLLHLALHPYPRARLQVLG